MSDSVLDDDMNIEAAPTEETEKEPVTPVIRNGDDPLRIHSFRRQIEAMQWRIEALRPGHPEVASLEAVEALETTLEELRVAVEELRQTNEALRDSRAEVEAERRRYRDLFEFAPDAYLVTNLLGVIREANQAALAQFNIEARFLVGKPLVLFLPDDIRSTFRTEIGRVRDQAGPSTFEYDLRLKPRKLSPFDATIRVGVERDIWGLPTALRWTIRDVSAKKRAEEKIRSLNTQLERRVVERSEQLESVLQTNERWLIKAHAADAQEPADSGLFQNIVDEVDAILWRGDAATGRYTFVSRRAEELLGFPASRWIDEPDFWLERIHPEDREWAASYRRKQLRERVEHEAEYRVVANDGRTFWFREVVRVIQRRPDEPAALYGMMVNITKRKKVERQLYTAKGELASQLRDMTYLHELVGRLTNARGLQATLDEILSAAVSLQGAEMAQLWLLETGRETPSIVASIGPTENFQELILDQGLASFDPLAIEDVQAEPEGSPWREAGQAGGFRAVAIVPLFQREGGPFGAVATFYKGPYRMAERQARLVEVYAEQAAEAIEAARLLGHFEESDRRKGRLVEAKALEMRAPLEAILEAARTARNPEVRDQIEAQAQLMNRLLKELVEDSRSG
jgi:PAS domain S-box-containing protein